jgi:hypothetical protein
MHPGLFLREVNMNGVWGRAGRVAVASLVVSVGVVSSAAAQSVLPWNDRGFVSVNFGGQTQARTSVVSGAFGLYDETATFESTIGVGSAGLFDISGGAKVWKNLGVGLAFSRYADVSSADVTMTIPDPLVFDRPVTTTANVSDLNHSENAVHVSAIWMLPMSDKIDVMVFGGPSFFSLNKDIVTGFTVQQNTQTVSSITTDEKSGSGTGAHFGFDVSYRIIKNLAAGMLIRYGSASVNVSEVSGGKVDVGGFNYGFGVRVIF